MSALIASEWAVSEAAGCLNQEQEPLQGWESPFQGGQSVKGVSHGLAPVTVKADVQTMGTELSQLL